jgi:mono/diheme cytochrome c family protein
MNTSKRSLLVFFALAAAATACRAGDERPAASGESDPASDEASLVARGKHLVDVGGCHDCHTPVKMGPNGPEPDLARALSGHPSQLVMPPAPALPEGPWVAVVGATMTAWNGPWGTTFTANLTPDRETGLGTWTAADFIATARTGRRMGKGRPILPPMPIQVLNKYTDEELTAMFAYLKSLRPMRNQVPTPIEPAAPKAAAAPAPDGAAVAGR